MIDTSFYFLVLLVILIYCIIKKSPGIGIFLYILYCSSALFAILLLRLHRFDSMLSVSNISIWPYVLMLLSYIIYFYPFVQRRTKFTSDKYYENVNKKYIIFAYFYIICAVIAISISVPTAITMIRSGNWSDSYNSESVRVYGNFIEYFALNFCGNLQLLAILTSFSLLRDSETDSHKSLPYILLICSILISVCHGILSTSRSMLFEISFTILAVYIFFFRSMKRKSKIAFNIMFGIAAFGMLILFMSISESRFETRGTSDYLLNYLGQAPIVFNTQVAGTIKKFSFGQLAFGYLMDRSPFNQSAVGGTWGGRFYTFIGWIYIDWGPVGTIIIGIILAFFAYAIISKEYYQMSDIYLMFSLLNIFIKGVFVIGRAYCINIIVTFVIYFITKIFFDKYTFTIKGHSI